MMEKVEERAFSLVEQHVEQRKAAVVSTLRTELPGDVVVTETSEGITLQAKGLSQRLLDDSGLRDVAFLIRNAR